MTGEKKASAVKFHRRALMTAADRLLVEHGYDGMNMNMLAKEADYSKATVYVYFDSKDEIVRALAIERLELVKRELELAVKSDLDADGKLAEVKRVISEFASEDKVYFDFVCRTADGAKITPESSESERRLYELVGEIVDVVCEIDDRDTILDKWYYYYGRLMTEKMFERL